MSREIKLIKEDLERFGSVVVAFSGGVDSSVVSALAEDALNGEAVAVTADSETLPDRELKEAKRIAKEIGIKHKVIEFSEFNEPDFSKNDLNRCYYCKRELFTNLKEFAERNGYNKVVDGTNATEVNEHRPGFEAIKELDIYSPLVEYEIDKDRVRKIASQYDLSVKNKPSMACLASRISHEEEITKSKLDMVEEAENYLDELGYRQFRVRKHRDLARIELPPEKIEIDNETMNKLNKRFKEIGFKYITLDLEGYRTGSME